jgi:hypothetical protein
MLISTDLKQYLATLISQWTAKEQEAHRQRLNSYVDFLNSLFNNKLLKVERILHLFEELVEFSSPENF